MKSHPELEEKIEPIPPLGNFCHHCTRLCFHFDHDSHSATHIPHSHQSIVDTRKKIPASSNESAAADEGPLSERTRILRAILGDDFSVDTDYHRNTSSGHSVTSTSAAEEDAVTTDPDLQSASDLINAVDEIGRAHV